MTSKYIDIKEEACEANKMLPASGLVEMTFGNVGIFDSEFSVFAIKPSGVPYEKLSPKGMVVVDLDGRVVEGKLRPSSDTPTYVELFKAFSPKAVVHTHSKYATAFAQALVPIPAFGTTHSDYFYGDVPVTRKMTSGEIAGEYEKNTGLAIVERFKKGRINPEEMKAVLVARHAPFVWGDSGKKAVENAKALEICAEMALATIALNPKAGSIEKALLKRHYFRKHGAKAYYGQNG